MVTIGCSLRNFATISPLRLAAFMRRDSVSSERPSIQHECGSSWVPIAERSIRIGFINSFDPSAAPAMRSEWPPTYFVSE